MKTLVLLSRIPGPGLAPRAVHAVGRVHSFSIRSGAGGASHVPTPVITGDPALMAGSTTPAPRGSHVAQAAARQTPPLRAHPWTRRNGLIHLQCGHGAKDPSSKHEAHTARGEKGS